MSEGQAYKNKVKPEAVIWLEHNYPNFITYISQMLPFEPIWSYKGETTSDGAVDGSTLMCSDLAGMADFDGNLVVITSGPYRGQARDISGSTLGGAVAPSLAFSGQIMTGTSFIIYALRLVPAEVAALTVLVNDIEDKLDHPAHGLAALLSEIDDNETLVTDVKSQTDNLAGEAPVGGNPTANWNSGAATSGNAGADLVTIGAAGIRYKIHSLLVSMANLTPGATVRIRIFILVNGTEQEVYNQTFIQGTDPDGLWIINGTIGIHDSLRVELHSNNAADDGAVVEYDYMLEAM